MKQLAQGFNKIQLKIKILTIRQNNYKILAKAPNRQKGFTKLDKGGGVHKISGKSEQTETKKINKQINNIK